MNTRRKGTGATDVFLANRYELWTALLDYERWQYLHKEPHRASQLALWEKALAVFITIVHLLRPWPHLVDRFEFFGSAAETWLVPVYRWHIRIALWSALPVYDPRKWVGSLMALWIMFKMILAAWQLKLLGKRSITFGAACKDQGLTEGGKLYVKVLGAKRPVLKHGDTLTAWTVLRQTLQIVDHARLPHEVFITGGTSKTGRVLALELAKRGFVVRLLTESPTRFQAILDEAAELGCARNIYQSKGLDGGANTLLWILGKDKGAEGIIKTMPINSYCLSFSVPDPLTPELLEERPDIVHIDGGLLAYQLWNSTQHFTMRLRPTLTYACHAWMLTSLTAGVYDDEINQVDLGQLEYCGSLALRYFAIPPYTSFLEPIEVPVYESGDTPRPRTPPMGVAA